jgi:hypothetical protein
VNGCATGAGTVWLSEAGRSLAANLWPVDGEPAMVTIDDVRAWAMSLPRSSEHLIHRQVKFRVGKIVYAAISEDETRMGVGFPKEERDAMVAAEPAKFSLPRPSDLRFHWVHASMAELDVPEMRELVTDAWLMVVPKRVGAEHLARVRGSSGWINSAGQEA